MAQGLTLEQLEGRVTLALEQAVHAASGQKFDTIHKLLWHTQAGRQMISTVRAAASRRALGAIAVRAAAAAKGTEPSAGFTDSAPDAQPVLSKAQEQAIRDLLTVWGLSTDGIARVIQELNTTLGVERLAEALQENASGNVLDGNSATAGGVGASADRGGFRPPRASAGLHALVRSGVIGAQEAEAEAAAQHAEAQLSGRRGGVGVLDLRRHSGRNVTEQALSKVRSENPKLDFDSAWVEACELVRRARAEGQEILT